MRIPRAVLALGASIVTLCTPAFVVAARAADVGDGQLLCNKYEICYSRDYPASSYQRDYYWSGNDTDKPGSWFWVNNLYGYGYVLNSASSINNRDTACDVWVVDWNQYGTVRINDEQFGHYPDMMWWQPFKSVLNDRNDAHLRCNRY